MKPKYPPYYKENKMGVALMDKYLSLNGMKVPALATRMSMSKSKLHRHRQDIDDLGKANFGKLTLDEFRRMVNSLGFSDEEKLNVIGKGW
jgi:hypothetical protein